MSANGTATKEVTATVMPRTQTTALVRHEPIEPQTMAELKDFAVIAADSGFFGAKTPQQAMMISMAGRDLGFSYTQALRAFHIIQGKPSLTADGMVAACLQHRDVCEFFRPVEQTSTRATWETRRVGDPEARRLSFSIDDARAAGLLEQNSAMWKKYPQRMLSARAKAYLARDVYPELLMGLYDPDELGDNHQREPAPVRVEATIAAPKPETMGAIGALRVALKRCAAEAEFKDVAKAAKRYADKGEITADEFATFKAEYSEAKTRVLTPPAPPPSKPAEAPAVAEADAPPEGDDYRGDDPENY